MSRKQAMLLMASVIIARSTSFIFSKHLMSGIQPMNILAVRFSLAFLLLVLLFRKRFAVLDRKTFLAGLALGSIYTAVMFFEMYGLKTIETGTSSFIENSAAVFIVVYEFLFFRQRPKPRHLISIAITVAGLSLLCLSGGISSVNIGILYAFIAMLLYAGAILLTDRLSRKIPDTIMAGVLQLGFMGLFSTILTFALETPRLPANPTEWTMILLLAIVCSCFGFTLQPTAQKYLDADISGIFTTLNPLAAALIGILFAGESAAPAKLTGCGLILFGLLFSISGKKN